MTRLLTISGRSLSIADWSRQPGAASYRTIVYRLANGWQSKPAVFDPSARPYKPGPVRLRAGRPSRSNGARLKRAAVRLEPNPHQANPFPPCVGGYRSWPIEALAILRRCA